MLIKSFIRGFTSLRLTVVLLAFAIILVFIGTLAQVDEGLYNAQARYFRQWLIVGLDLFGHRVPLILPGGYLIGTMLLANLLAAHIYRFQFTVKKIGIQIAHSGVILLLVGQLATDMFAHESQIRFAEGETKTYAESSQNYEMAFTVDTGANTEQVITVPQSRLVPGHDVQDPNLPFTLHILSFWKNSAAGFRAPMVTTGPPLTTNGVAVNFDFQPQPEVKTMDDKNVPTAEVEIIGPSGSLGDWIVSGWTADEGMRDGLRQDYARQLGPEMARQIISDLAHAQAVTINGRKYSFALRPVRIYLPFSMTLLKATHTVYQGTDIPKDFRSRVQLQNNGTGENRAVDIYMNSPLRYSGLTFYQYQMTAGEMAVQAGVTPTSVLQVVHNPSWLTPYVGCGLVALGLVVQFMFHLVGFLSKRKTS
jgi:hypothetical protein